MVHFNQARMKLALANLFVVVPSLVSGSFVPILQTLSFTMC